MRGEWWKFSAFIAILNTINLYNAKSWGSKVLSGAGSIIFILLSLLLFMYENLYDDDQ